ncbi:hypothetical protein ACMAUO_07420 [Gluconacetobacter sp. Hr-1-5]|uniref:hypothetical protein n=1 Tax=Gluconacetobacter sp. Hr-1-5 TaxID=3395370 RepID=UPI003B518535
MMLFRCGLVAGVLAVPVSAWAQYAPFRPPGGLAPATVVGSQTLAQMQAATLAAQAVAAGAIPSSQKGVAGGVAALDGGGDVTAPLIGDATHAAVTPAGGAATMLGAYLGILAKSSDLSAYLTVTAAGQVYATQTALAATTGTANAALTAAQGAVPSSRVGAASGVAGLNASGQVTAPIAGDVTGAPVTPAGGSSVTLGTYLGGLATLAGLSAETMRATGAEAALQGNINTEAATRANADATLCAVSGCAMTGGLSAPSLVVGSNISVVTNVNLNSSSGVYRQVQYQTEGINRWSMAVDSTSEADGNVGSNWTLVGFSNSGAYLYNALLFSRATGVGKFYVAPQFPTPPAGDNSTNAETTAGVRREIATGYTVATLPTDARRYTGARAFVTDATACAFLGSLTGGGSTFCPVIYSGTAWIAE